MFNVEVQADINGVNVHTTSNRGFTPEEIAERAVEKIVFVADGASPEVRAQADAFKNSIEKLILFYIRQAIASDRSTVAGLLEKQGHKDMADIIRRL